MPDEPKNGDRATFYSDLSRLEGRLDEIGEFLRELVQRTSTLDCGEHRARLDELERKVAAVATGAGRSRPPSGEQRPRTGQGYQAVTQRDLDHLREDTKETVIAELTRTAEVAAEEAVERVRALEEQRGLMDRIKALESREHSVPSVGPNAGGFWPMLARYAPQLIAGLLSAAIGAGLVASVKCELPHGARGQGAALQHTQQPRVDAAGK